MSSCKNCGYVSSDGSGCLLLNIPIYDKGRCDFFRYNPKRCDVCGALLPPYVHSTLEFVDDKYVTVCDNCEQSMDRCVVCQRAHDGCAFQNLAYSSGIAPFVQKTIHQGNMTAIMQVKNPELMAQACSSCTCYADGECIRENGKGCPSFHLNIVPV